MSWKHDVDVVTYKAALRPLRRKHDKLAAEFDRLELGKREQLGRTLALLATCIADIVQLAADDGVGEHELFEEIEQPTQEDDDADEG